MNRNSSRVIPFKANRSTRIQIPFATPVGLKTAQISALPDFHLAHPFSRACWPELEAFQPRALIGYGVDLERLAAQVAREELSLRSVDYAIFALTDSGNRPITDFLRVELWQTFGVPVYELIVAPGCRLLAAECEAHEGWHLQGGAQVYQIDGELVCDLPSFRSLRTGLSGGIEREPCACGRLSPRLTDLTPCLPRRHPRPLAAAA